MRSCLSTRRLETSYPRSSRWHQSLARRCWRSASGLLGLRHEDLLLLRSGSSDEALTMFLEVHVVPLHLLFLLVAVQDLQAWLCVSKTLHHEKRHATVYMENGTWRVQKGRQQTSLSLPLSHFVEGDHFSISRLPRRVRANLTTPASPYPVVRHLRAFVICGWGHNDWSAGCDRRGDALRRKA